MNLSAAPISTRPPTTLTEFIQSPLRGSFESMPGARASRKNGKATTLAKVARPMIGYRKLPPAAITSSPPTTGNVQVNDVIVSVKAMKKTPISPPGSRRATRR